MKPNLDKLTKEMFKDWQPIMSGKKRIGWGKDPLTEELFANEIEEHVAQQLALNAEIEKVKAQNGMVQDFGFYLHGDLPAGRSHVSIMLNDAHRELDQRLAELEKMKELI